MENSTYLSGVFACDIWWAVISEHKNKLDEKFYYCFSKDDDEYITFMEHEVIGFRYSLSNLRK